MTPKERYIETILFIEETIERTESEGARLELQKLIDHIKRILTKGTK
jgi:hypothetical protein